MLKPEYFYILKCENFYKIGCSVNPNKRFAIYRTHCPFYIQKKLVRKVYDAYRKERMIKRYYKMHRKSEWILDKLFDLPAVKRFIISKRKPTVEFLKLCIGDSK